MATRTLRDNVAWLSEYLLMPFVWSDDTFADWVRPRLFPTTGAKRPHRHANARLEEVLQVVGVSISAAQGDFRDAKIRLPKKLLYGIEAAGKYLLQD